MHKCLLTAEREPMASQSQLDDPMNCVAVTHRSIDERSFTEPEMTQRQLITKSMGDRSPKLGSWNSLDNL